MQLKRVTCASALTVGLSVAALMGAVGTAAAEPGAPCGPGPGPCQGPGGPGGPGGPDRGPGGPGGPDRGPGGPPGGHWDGPGGPGGPGGPPGGHWDGPGRAPWGPPDGPPPPPPPELGWRGIDQGRFDHQPFNYNGSWVTPIFNPDFNNWGFWFFGIWIPL